MVFYVSQGCELAEVEGVKLVDPVHTVHGIILERILRRWGPGGNLVFLFIFEFYVSTLHARTNSIRGLDNG